MMTSYLSPSFFPLCSRNIISSHKSLWKCHSHNKGVFNAEISIYSRAGFLIYFMQIPAFYVFCRKSSNIFEKNLRTRGFIRKSLYKILEQINEKFRAGINGYFCIKKILHFNGNVYFSMWFLNTYLELEISGLCREFFCLWISIYCFLQTNQMIIHICTSEILKKGV